MSNSFNLIPIVSAQALDSIAQPTFGIIDVGSQGGAIASVTVSSSSTSTTVGEIFKVIVRIETNDQLINEYRVMIDFDPLALSVVDQDPATVGTQITLLDTIFTVADPQVDNVVSSTGRVTLLASTPSGNGFSVNRNVAEIEFQSQRVGVATVRVVQGSVGTQLVRTNGTSLSFTPNEVSIQVSTQQQVPDDVIPIIPTPIPANPQIPPQENVINLPDTIPNTAIDSSSFLPLVSGVFMLGVGIALLSSGFGKKR